MAWWDVFKKPTPIVTVGDLDDFLDSRAAFLVQKCVYEFCRAAAGYNWQPLFQEKAFLEALEQSRWQAYPHGLADMGEMVLGVLRQRSEAPWPGLLSAMEAAIGRVTGRYPSPAGLPEDFWTAARQVPLERIRRSTLKSPRQVKDIPLVSAPSLHAVLPLHERIRGDNPSFVGNNLTMSLIQIHGEFLQRTDIPSLAALLADAQRAE